MKTFLTLLMFVFLFSFVSADSWTYDDSGQWAGEYAMVTGMYPECEGNQHGIYCAGKYYADVSHSGDQFNIQYRSDSWMTASDSTESHSGGLTSGEAISDGRIYLNENGKVPYYQLGAYDYAKASNGDWGYRIAIGGYLGNKYFNLYNVDCYEDSDCSSDRYCKKDGEWNDWQCIRKECDSGQEKCVGTNSYSCENYKWQNKGVILNKCGVSCLRDSNCPADQKVREYCSSKGLYEEFRTYSCSNYRCVSRMDSQSKGYVLNKCGVECLSDSNCPEDDYAEDKYCKDNNVVQLFRDYRCENYLISFTDEERVLEECDWKCEVGKCIVHICDEGETKCVGDELMICKDNEFIVQEVCERGCEEGKCVVNFFADYKFYILTICFLVLLIGYSLRKKK